MAPRTYDADTDETETDETEIHEEAYETDGEEGEAEAPPPRKRTTKKGKSARAPAKTNGATKARMERGGTTDVGDTWTGQEEDEEGSDLAARVEHLEAERRNEKEKARATILEKARSTAQTKATKDEDETGDEELPFGEEDDEVSPIDMVVPQNDPWVRIERLEANGPSRGFDAGSDYTGFCGNVIHRLGFEAEVCRQWGGGKYRATVMVNGKAKSRPLVFNGIASLPPAHEREGEETAEEYAETYTAPTGGGYGRFQGGAAYGGGYGGYPGGGYPAGHGYQAPAYGAPAMQPAAALPPGWSHAPGGGYYTPHGYSTTGPTPQTTAQQMAQVWPLRENEHATLLREELEKTRRDMLEAQKASEIEKVRREFEVREKELTQKIELLVSEVRNKRDDTGGISDLIKIQAQQWEREREDRRLKQEEDRLRREEEREREVAQRRDERDKYEREARERREREDREFKEREIRLREERDRDAKLREQADRQWDKLMSTMFTNQPKLTDILGMVQSVKDMAGPDNTVSKLAEMVEAVATLKDLADDRPGAEETGVDKAQRLVEAVGRAVTPALGEIAKIVRKPAAQQPEEDQNVYQQERALPAYDNQQAYQQQAQQPTQAVQQPQRAAPSRQQAPVPEGPITDLTPEQWGKTLQFVVDAYEGGAPPGETTAHLFTLLRAWDAVLAAQRIAETNVSAFKSKVSLLKISGRITSRHYLDYMERFVKLCDDQKGRPWLGELISYVSETCEALQKRAEQAIKEVNAQVAAEEAESEDEEGDEEGDSP